MLEVLSAIIVKAIEKIIGSSIDTVAKKVSWKSSLAAKLINLFSCLCEIEKSSQEFYEDLLLLASGKEPITEIAKVPMGRIVIRKRSGELKNAVTKFSEQFKEIEAYLSIYDNEVSFGLNDIMLSKTRYIKAIDFFLASCPSFREFDDLSTGYLVFPSALPGLNMVNEILCLAKKELKINRENNLLLDRGSEDKNVSSYSDKANSMILAEFGMREAHIHSASDVQYILERVEKDIKKIEQARLQLAEFIKNNLPLEKILS